MSVHLFGEVWSASCASFGLLRTARNNDSEFHPSVSSTIKKNFYVDDCFKSVKSQDEAIDLVVLTSCKDYCNVEALTSQSGSATLGQCLKRFLNQIEPRK